MSREALAAVLLQLPQLSDRLHFARGESLDLVADDARLVHLEQRLVGCVPQVLTPPMDPGQLLALVDGMGLALDLDRHLTPSRSVFRAAAPGRPHGPAPAASRPGRRRPKMPR